MTVAESFETMVTLFNPNAAGSMNKTLQWNITGEEAGKYALKVANGTCELIKGGVEKPDMTLTMADKDWLAIADGKLDPMNAFATGKLKVAGDMMLAMKIQQLFPIKR
ncbi:MAG TPA: SCP2 sterol-binding domain-containing protein [Ktedonobacteraceae bacterium]|jgi:putative sterol carrier protein|nr:SCP2 sterol-binding domain-containing protein [Ktedonobacteraceae bacterium]